MVHPNAPGNGIGDPEIAGFAWYRGWSITAMLAAGTACGLRSFFETSRVLLNGGFK